MLLAKARRTKPYMSGSWNQASERRAVAGGVCVTRFCVAELARNVSTLWIVPSREMSPRIVSLNVGVPRTLDWHGQTVTTGIFKSPVVGSVRLAELNFDGDRQADLS